MEFSYWQDVIDQIADMDIPLHSLLKNSVAYFDNNVVYIKASDGFNDYIRSNKEVNGIIKKAIYTACGRPYNIGGYKNIAHKFRDESHDSLQDIMALRDKGVTINFKD